MLNSIRSIHRFLSFLLISSYCFFLAVAQASARPIKIPPPPPPPPLPNLPALWDAMSQAIAFILP
jgi:hypothetical protein